jgi:H+-transporting ATPase
MAETGAAPPNHLGTDVPSGHLDEKKDYNGTDNKEVPPKKDPDVPGEEEEEDEDIDALIEELESQDANIDPDEEEDNQPGGARTIPEEMLQTDTRTGLSSSEVLARRKKYGLNQMKEEKENLILKFLGYFIGPIQFVMEAAAVLAAGLQVCNPAVFILIHVTTFSVFVPAQGQYPFRTMVL